MLNQDTKMQRYVPNKLADQYYILDTTTSPTKVAVLDAANGRQGDNMRAIPLAFVSDSIPVDLTSTKITLKVLDHAGVVKVTNTVINPVDLTGGIIVFGLPARLYENVGEVERAYFTLSKTDPVSGVEQVISTVNVTFTVLEDGIDLSKQQSTIYISSLDRILNSTENIATTTSQNSFTVPQQFTNVTASTVSASSISSPTLSAMSKSTATVSKSVSSLASQTNSNNSSINAVSSAVQTLSSSLKSLTASSSASSVTSDSDDYVALSTSVSANSVTTSSVVARVDGLDTELASMPSSFVKIDDFTTLSNTVANLATDNGALSLAQSAMDKANNVSSACSSNAEDITSMSSVVTSISNVQSSDHDTSGVAIAGFKALLVANATMKMLSTAIQQGNLSGMSNSYTSVASSLSALNAVTMKSMLDTHHDFFNDLNNTYS